MLAIRAEMLHWLKRTLIDRKCGFFCNASLVNVLWAFFYPKKELTAIRTRRQE